MFILFFMTVLCVKTFKHLTEDRSTRIWVHIHTHSWVLGSASAWSRCNPTPLNSGRGRAIEWECVCVWRGYDRWVAMFPCNLLNSSLSAPHVSAAGSLSTLTNTHSYTHSCPLPHLNLLAERSSEAQNIFFGQTHTQLFFINILSVCRAAVRYCRNWFPHRFKNTV